MFIYKVKTDPLFSVVPHLLWLSWNRGIAYIFIIIIFLIINLKRYLQALPIQFDAKTFF